MTSSHPTAVSGRRVLAAMASVTALVVTAALTPDVGAANAATSPAAAVSPRDERADHRVVHRDARRDVLHFDVASQAGRPAPRNRATDITSTVVDHRARRLVMHARVRHLSRAGYRLMIVEVLGSDGRRYDLEVDYSTTPIGPRLNLERLPSGKDLACPGTSWSISRQTNRTTASIPTSCLGDPGWVRVGIGLVGASHDLKTSWADDSRARGRVGAQHLHLGPRQHLG